MKITEKMFYQQIDQILTDKAFTGQIILHMNQGDIVKYELRQTYHKKDMEKKLLTNFPKNR